MTRQALYRLVGAILVLFSLALLGWGLRPSPSSAQTTELSLEELFPTGQAPNEEATGADPPGPGQWAGPVGSLILEWPARLRSGDAGEIRLHFVPVEEGRTLLAGNGPEDVRIFRARLEMPGIRHTPGGEISQALSLENPLTFLWNLRADSSGSFQGEVWLSLQYNAIHDDHKDRKVLYNQQISIQVEEILGMSGRLARFSGGAGLLLGVSIFLAGRRPSGDLPVNSPNED